MEPWRTLIRFRENPDMQQCYLSRLRPVPIRRVVGAACVFGPLSALFIWLWCGMLNEQPMFSSAAHFWQGIFITVLFLLPLVGLLSWVPVLKSLARGV